MGALLYLGCGFLGAIFALVLLFWSHRDQQDIGLQDLFGWAFLCLMAVAFGPLGLVMIRLRPIGLVVMQNMSME